MRANPTLITSAGYIHGIFALIGAWAIMMFYLTPLSSPVSKTEMVSISILLTPFFYLGIKKFNPCWVFTKEAKKQVLAGISATWAITLVRIFFLR